MYTCIYIYIYIHTYSNELEELRRKHDTYRKRLEELLEEPLEEPRRNLFVTVSGPRGRGARR